MTSSQGPELANRKLFRACIEGTHSPLTAMLKPRISAFQGRSHHVNPESTAGVIPFLLGVPSADAVHFIPPRFLDLDPGVSTQIQANPGRSEYMVVE